MPVDANARTTVSAFAWVPQFARGLVRDLRVRWALEEAGRDYAEQLLTGETAKGADYLHEQPFGQVPAYRDGATAMFESGAIVLYVAQDCPGLLPEAAEPRARATSWLFCALNTVEPHLQQLAEIDLFGGGAPWTVERRPQVEERVRGRLATVAKQVEGRDYLEDSFTAGDLMMTTVLRIVRNTGLVAEFPALAAYQARCETRPAFERALTAQMAAFKD